MIKRVKQFFCILLLFSSAITNVYATTPTISDEPELVELARSLQNDPLLIFEYVRNHVDYEPYFGYKKGPLATYLELSGNDFDQASLLVQLLRISGYTANYVYGDISMSIDSPGGQYSLVNWLIGGSGSPTTSGQASAVGELLATAGIPYEYDGVGMKLNRVWVTVNVNGADYQLDPALKVYKRKYSLDLREAMGFTSGEILSVAGGIVGTDSISNLDEAAISGKLTDYTMSLVSYLNTNYPNATVDEVLGGKEIVEKNYDQLPTSLEGAYSSTIEPWVEIPDAYTHVINIKHGAIDQTFKLPDISKKKISIDYETDATAGTTGVWDRCIDINSSEDVIDLGVVNGSVGLCVDDPSGKSIPQTFNGYYRKQIGSVPGVTLQPQPGPRLSGNGTCLLENYFGVTTDNKMQLDYFDSRGDGVVPGQSYEIVLEVSYAAYISGRNLCSQPKQLRFNVTAGQSTANLKIDDVMVAQSLVSGYGTREDITITYDAPYVYDYGTYADFVNDSSLMVGGEHVIVFGGSSFTDRTISTRESALSRYIKNDDPRALSEALYQTGLTWFVEENLANYLTSLILNTNRTNMIGVGVFSQAETYSMDIVGDFKAENIALSGWFLEYPDMADKVSSAIGTLMASGLEHGVFEQLQGENVEAVSAVKWLAHSNALGKNTYRLTQANYSTIKPLLSGYSSSDLSQMRNEVNNGHVLFIPKKGNMTIGQASGYGYLDFHGGYTHSPGMMLSNQMNGGGGTEADYDMLSVESFMPEPFGWGRWDSPALPKALSDDPVDMLTGEFYYNVRDLALGRSEPNGLSVNRVYRSGRVNKESPLSYGWSHNYDVAITDTTDISAAFGIKGAKKAALLIATFYSMIDVLNVGEPGLKEWMTGVVISNWVLKQTHNNARTVVISGEPHNFIKMPDGSFLSHSSDSLLLTKQNGLYRIVDEQGDQIDFNATNKISSWIDIHENEMIFEYKGDKLDKVTDSYNRTLKYAYSNGLIDKITDSAGRVIDYNYDPVTNELTSVTNANGYIWRYGYDSTRPSPGFINTVTDPENNLLVTNYYNDLNQVTRQVMPRQGGAKSYQADSAEYKLYFNGFINIEEKPTGAKKISYFDKLGRNISEQDAYGGRIYREYDGSDNVIRLISKNGVETHFERTNSGKLKRVIDDDGNVIEYLYDVVGNLEKTIDAAGNETSYKYNDKRQVVKKVDAENNIWIYDYYPNGQIKSSINPEGVVTTNTYDVYGVINSGKKGALPPTQFVNNSIGHRTSLLDAYSNETVYSYDNYGKTKTVKDPFYNITTYDYWKNGNIKSVTDRNNDTVARYYTVSGKLERIEFPDTSVIRYYYDNQDRLREIVQPEGSVFYEYDLNDRVSKYTDVNGFEIQYTYTSFGKVETVTYPGNKTLVYNYNKYGYLTKVTDWTQREARLEYDVIGRFTKLENINGTVVKYKYNNLGQIIGLDNTKPNGEIINAYQFSLNGLGNIESIEKDEPLLMQATAGTTNYQFNDSKNRLLSVDENSLSYDDEGQLNTYNGDTYTFDYGKRLKSITGTNNIQYSYDPSGRRVSANRDGVITKYIYDVSGNLVAEADSSGAIQRYYIYANGLISTIDDNDNVFAYHFNASGSTIAISDSSKDIVNSYVYTPYGLISNQQQAFDQPFKYIGKHGVVAEPGNLYYMRARYYDAHLGRFISQDPLGYAGGPNLYGYTVGDPVNNIDPAGTLSFMHHWSISYEAARDFGLGVIDSMTFATSVVMVDSGTQGYGANHTNIHAMAAYGQDPEDAIMSAELIMSDPNNSIYVRSHTAQDYSVPHHLGQVWASRDNTDQNWFSKAWDVLVHIVQDTFISDEERQEAYDRTMDILNEYKPDYILMKPLKQ